MLLPITIFFILILDRLDSIEILRPLGNKTMATSAVDYNDILEYNAHNIYGLSEAIMTNKALRSIIKKSPFILTCSNFVGSGVHAIDWTRDNAATWDDLWYSMLKIIKFGLFGIPMVGANIYGFS